MVDLTPFKADIEAAMKQTPIFCDDPRTTFMDVLSGHGLTPPRQLRIDVIDRIDGAEDRRGKGSAWYVYHEFEVDSGVIGVAEFGDWKTGLRDSWQSQSEYRMSDKERSSFLEARELMTAQRELEELQRNEEAAKNAHEIWNNAPTATNDHPYLIAKGVKSHPHIKLSDRGDLIIPAANSENQIVSLQYIKQDGSKRFLTGGKMKGAYCFLEGNNDAVYIAEGFSTAASVYEATGHCTYIAFNAGNLYEIASMVKGRHPDARIIIAGDDDFHNESNAGRIKAEQAAQGLGIECVFPNGTVDFNDMHKEQGIDALSAWFKQDRQEPYKEKTKPKDADFRRPSGVMGDIFDYYHATCAYENREGYATQCALAVTAVILGRIYKTNYNNYSNLFLLSVGESSTGKEHGKGIFEKIIYKSKMGHLVGGDGYTSAGAVFSTLLRSPNHGGCIDELGRYLKASSGKGGNPQQYEANTKLMEAIGRTNGVMRPPNYSTMTLKKDMAKEMENKFTYNPCITLLTATTPSTLFNSIDIDAVEDGFIARFVIDICDKEPTVRLHKESLDVPENILDWIKVVRGRAPKKCLANSPADPVVIPLSNGAYELQLEFQQYLLDTKKKLKKYSMDALTGKTNEMAMKIALNVALSRDPYTDTVKEEDMEWAIWYAKRGLNQCIEALKLNISHSEYEADKKAILVALRERGAEGITKTEMNKTPPFSKFKSKDLLEMLNALKEGELAFDETIKTKGRPTVKWTALN